jgi:hypothetical protein
MPETLTPPDAPAPAAWRRLLPFALCVALGLAVGFGAATLFPTDPYTAKAETLTGTVHWSNQQTQLIAFEADGVKRGRLDGDTFYSVIPDHWQDAAGTYQGTGEYPTCLAGEKDSPVSTDRHRVRLEVMHRDTGGVQPQHIAVHVQCLD